MLPFVEKNKMLAVFLGVAGISLIGGGAVGAPAVLANVFGKRGPTVAVHVAGHVKKPGLYHLDPTARVDDAVKAAGGATEDADTNQLNLAAAVEDGSQIHVPAEGETLPVPATPVASTSHTRTRHARGSSKASAPVGQIALNSASAAELDQLPGVGPATAQKIIDYRNANGGFKSVDEVQRVKGIGPKKYAQMAPYLSL